jgi:hypothetical protein
MSVESPSITDADILAAVVAPQQPTMSAEAARFFLDLRFTQEQIEHMHALAEKNNMGTLTEGERADMESYARVGSFISLVQSKARLSLKRATDT